MEKFRALLHDGVNLRKSSSKKIRKRVSVAVVNEARLGEPLQPASAANRQNRTLNSCEILIIVLADQLTELNELRNSNSTANKSEGDNNVVLLDGQLMDLTAVVKIASEVRKIQCRISRRPVLGDHDWIIFVQFVDNIEWIARIPRRSRRMSFDTAQFKERYECMIATVEYVAINTTLPVPRVHQFDLSCDSILRRPYILMDCLSGKPLSSCLDSLNDKQIRSVVRQWAQYTMELASLQFSQIGSLRTENDTFVIKSLLPHNINESMENRGPFGSVADYILAMSDIKKRSIAAANSNPHKYGNFLRSSLIESLIPFFVLPEYLNSPFVLSHRTLDIHSILVDNAGRLTGVLSWQNAAILPLQSHIRVPDSLNLEFMPPSETKRHPSRTRFSKKYRLHFEKALIEAGAESEWNIPELIDRSLMFGLFERAILSAKDERFLPALWEHVFGNAAGAEDFRRAMKKGDWGVAMADRWGIEV